jgi:hypothetical protein
MPLVFLCSVVRILEATDDEEGAEGSKCARDCLIAVGHGFQQNTDQDKAVTNVDAKRYCTVLPMSDMLFGERISPGTQPDQRALSTIEDMLLKK